MRFHFAFSSKIYIYRLRNKRHIVADQAVKYSFPNKESLPLIIEHSSLGTIKNLQTYLNQNNSAFKEKLVKYGAVLFRGFQCNSTDSFSQAVQACSLGSNYAYDFCEVPRTKLSENIYSSVEIPPDFNLELHNEKSHDQNFPTHVFFSCIEKAREGGLTPLANAHNIWLSLPKNLQEKLQSKDIKYRKFFFGNGVQGKQLQTLIPNFNLLTWMHKFNSDDKPTVEKKLQDLGYDYQWTEDDNLITEYILPAYRIHPVSGKSVWFNQSNHLNLYNNNINRFYKTIIKDLNAQKLFLSREHSPFMASFGDGQDFSEHESNVIQNVINQNTVTTPWQPGDFMILDNYLCLHGKMPHQGKRLILVSLTQYIPKKHQNASF